MTADKPRRLGRGLEALLQSTPTPSAAATVEQSALRRVPVAQIRPNPFQPRRHFDPGELAELETSIREAGLLQPVTVRSTPGGAGFELIAGERRLRAAARLGWSDIPAVVKEVDDRTVLTLALIENLQRSDLNPLEEAEGYRRLIEEFGLTQQQIAESIGRDRSSVANSLRILGLPASVRRMIQEGQLSFGHAKALLSLGDESAMVDLARRAVADGWSVREVERRVRTAAAPRAKAEPSTRPADKRAPEVRRIEDQLRHYLQTDVRVVLDDAERGRLEIAFYSADDLERILDLTLGPGREGA